MMKTILITGSTDGIGFETAGMLLAQGHHILLHGRSVEKLEKTEKKLRSEGINRGEITRYVSDLSNMADVEVLAQAIIASHKRIDVLINNAGVFKAPKTITKDGLDIHFAVNTLAPYLLTKRLLPLLGTNARVINLSSAAQSPVDLEALLGNKVISEDFSAYAQSKLAITMWSRALAQENSELVVFAVNPGSMLGSKMVKDNFGVAGNDISIGAKILTRLALNEEFSIHSGEYFDNDIGKFSEPHSDGVDIKKCQTVVKTIENVLFRLS